jgi:chromosome segregation ATPase
VFRVCAEDGGGRSRHICFACAIEAREKETSDCREMLGAVQTRLCESQENEVALRKQLDSARRDLEAAREETLRTRESVEADFRRDLKEATRRADKAQSVWKEAERELRDSRELSSSLFAKNNVLIEELGEARAELDKAEKRQEKTLGVVRGCLKDMSERNNRWRKEPVLSYIERLRRRHEPRHPGNDLRAEEPARGRLTRVLLHLRFHHQAFPGVAGGGGGA